MINFTKEYMYARDCKYKAINSDSCKDYGYLIENDNGMFAYPKGWTFVHDRATVLDRDDIEKAYDFYKNIMKIDVEIVLVLPENYNLELEVQQTK